MISLTFQYNTSAILAINRNRSKILILSGKVYPNAQNAYRDGHAKGGSLMNPDSNYNTAHIAFLLFRRNSHAIGIVIGTYLQFASYKIGDGDAKEDELLNDFYQADVIQRNFAYFYNEQILRNYI